MKIDKDKIERTLACMEQTIEAGCDGCRFSSGKIFDCVESDRHVVSILELVKNKKEI